MCQYLRPRVTLAIALICALVPSLSAYAEDCQPLLDEFNRTIDEGNESQAQSLVEKIAISADCGQYQVPVQRRLAALRLNFVQQMMARGRPVADYEDLLLSAVSPEVLWQASATLGEVRFGERRFADAAQAYDLAVEIIKNEASHAHAPVEIRYPGIDRPVRGGAPSRRQWCGLRRRREVRQNYQRSTRWDYWRILFPLGARHSPAGNSCTNHLRISINDVHQCWTGCSARTARGTAGAKAVAHLTGGAYGCAWDSRIQHEVIARSCRRCGFVSQTEWLGHSHRDGWERRK